jgi:hypothetical protein
MSFRIGTCFASRLVISPVFRNPESSNDSASTGDDIVLNAIAGKPRFSVQFPDICNPAFEAQCGPWSLVFMVNEGSPT